MQKFRNGEYVKNLRMLTEMRDEIGALELALFSYFLVMRPRNFGI